MPPPPPDARPEIRIGPELHEVVEQAVRALASGPAEVYQRAAGLVAVVRAPAEGDQRGRIRRLPESPFLHPYTMASLKPALTAAARFVRYVAKEDAWMQCRPDGDIVAAALDPHAAGRWPGLPRLEGLLEAPALRLDGSILAEPGYDEATGYVLVPGERFVPVPESPTQEDARAALRELVEPLVDFPHVGEPAKGAVREDGLACGSARSAWVAALMTLLARPAITGSVPAWIFDASTRGSGKSLQADLISIIASGRPASRMSWPGEDDEAEKIMGGYALSGDPLICFDNVSRPFGGDAVDRCLTAVDTVQLRVLGKSGNPAMIWRSVILATGNNVEVRGDTVRRTMFVRLESLDEHPENRDDFRIPGGSAGLRTWCAEHRPRLVRAALTILRAWHLAGRPQEGVAVWGGFEGWATVVPPAIVWAGGSDPLLSRPATLGEEESDKSALRTILEHWSRLESYIEGTGTAGQATGKGITLRQATITLYKDAVARLKGEGADDGWDDLRDAIEGLVPTKPGQSPDLGKLGGAVKRLKGRAVGGRRLKVASAVKGGKGGTRWTVEVLG